jgi:predicted flap endonuclease-1-like 5' DNA nuclease
MSDKKPDGLFSCGNICWMLAVVLAFAIFIFVRASLNCGPFLSILAGIGSFFVIGWGLGKLFCSETTPASSEASSPEAAVVSPAPVAPTAPAAPVAPVKAPEAAKPVAEPAAPTVEVVKDVEPEKKAPAKKAPAAKAPAKKAATKKAPAKAVSAKKAPAKAAPEKDAAPTDAADEKKPRTMKAPRKAGADNLKLLKGVGPKLEETLNGLGFYHFDQVAKWGAAEIAWVDARLKFKGRIERDGWIEQAKILADGGETEFSKRSGKA